MMLSCVIGHAQLDEYKPYSKKPISGRSGLIRSGMGLKLGNNGTFSGFYGSGDLEYYIDEQVSLEGEGNYFLGVLGELTTHDVVNNHSLLSGVNYHFLPHGGFDPYAGLKVGAAFTEMDRINHEDGTECFEKLDVDPLAAIQLGFNYYTGPYFHMYMETGYQMQKHNTPINPGLKLNDINFKFGLGVHVDWFCARSHKIPNGNF